MNNLIANYTDHRKAFEEVVSGRSQRRILLIKGVSGTGKTTLLQHCLQNMPKGILVVRVELRDSVVTVAEIFSRIGSALHWERMQTFTEFVAKYQNAPRVHVDGNWLVGINNHISVALQTPDITDREHRRAALTDAVFADLVRLEQGVLLVFDSYEKAPEEMQAWISGPLLSRVAATPPVRVVVAGQDIPETNNIEWGDCSRTLELKGVPDAEHWLPLVKYMGWQIEAKDPGSYLSGVCGVFKGNPDLIMKYLTVLPRDEN